MRRTIMFAVASSLVGIVAIGTGPGAMAGGSAVGPRAERHAAELQTTIDELEASLAELEASLDRARSQRDVALDGREVAEADARATDRESRNWRIATYLLALITATTWLVAWGRRRDTIRIRIPSTVEEFETQEDRADR